MRSSLLAIALAVAVALGAAGCTPDLCGRNSDCAYGLVCTNAGTCKKPTVDAGTTSDGATAVIDAGIDATPPIEGPGLTQAATDQRDDHDGDDGGR